MSLLKEVFREGDSKKKKKVCVLGGGGKWAQWLQTNTAIPEEQLTKTLQL